MKEKKLYKIAFMGEKDHGCEIISTLESWGGFNEYSRNGSKPEYVYFINDLGTIDLILNSEMLSEKMKNFYFMFWHDYNIECKLKVGETFNYGGLDYDVDSILFDTNNRCIVYKLKSFGIGVEYITNNDLNSTKDMIEKKETTGFMQLGKTVAVCFNKENYETEVELQLGDYKIEFRDGKTYAVLKKTVYPKTYEECCLIVGGIASARHLQYDTIPSYKFEEDLRDSLETLRKLLICRKAYWKIAGEQMGLGKPWEPDWDNLSTNHEYIILEKGCFTYSNHILVFPTEEMRDAFYENFKDLIEQCKELL